MCLRFIPIHSGRQLRSTYQPESHRRKVTQDFSSAFFLRCVPSVFLQEGFNHSLPSSTVMSNFALFYTRVCTCSLLLFSSNFNAPLFVREHRKWNQQILQQVQNLVPHDYIKSCTVYTVVQQYVLLDYCCFHRTSLYYSPKHEELPLTINAPKRVC